MWVGARAASADEDPPGTHRDWGITWDLRAGGAGGGGYGDFLRKGTAWDFDLHKQRGDWRYGVGLMFGSLSMYPSPLDQQPEWAHFEPFVYASRVFRRDEPFRGYLQGRFSIVRMHPRSELFLKEPEDELDSGESPTDAVNGVGLSLLPGVELDLSRKIAIDLSGYLNFYWTEKYKLQDYLGNRPIDHEDTGFGIEWGGRVGATWRPVSYDRPVTRAASPDTTPLPPESRYKDAWDVTRSHGWAAGEVLMINFGAAMFNEYVRQANFNQVSPRSVWSNLEEGFTFDDNKLKTNQFAHSFNGSTYYASGRANGIDYWWSCVYALAGAFIWEAAGETHPMSYNDMIATGFGGMAWGESMYRLSSEVLDNRATGSGRTWREIGGFLIDPVRGFNRFISGHASRVQGNPSSPYDHHPPRYFTSLGVGARRTGSGESISDSTETRGVIDLYVNHGSPWENERRRPFDHFDVGIQVNGHDKVPIGRLQIRGDLFSNAFGGETGNKHAIAFVQYFDYINNDRIEFGGQSFGGALFSRFRESSKLGITTRLDLLVAILAAVNSEYAYVVETPDQERQREYDYGPGAGFEIEVAGTWKARRILYAGYRAEWISVTNGSVWVPEGNPGSDANHYLQSLRVKLNIPVRGVMYLGMDGALWFRHSHYSNPDFVDTVQRIPQTRLYLAFDTAR
jgi:hypothetical protein